MPELPEVETTRRGLESHVTGKKVLNLCLYRRDLRWPIPPELPAAILDQEFHALKRRGKYLVFEMSQGVLLAHLGMSGSLRLSGSEESLRKHDHWELTLNNGVLLRYNDPRRFGLLFWIANNWEQHALIRNLGPEPLGPEFTADYLYQSCRGRTLAIKNHIMNSRTVVGVGNIYAAESLFHGGIHPEMPAGKLSRPRAARLVEEIRAVLSRSIEQGGTTLRDYVNGNGQPGYFKQQLWVYGRGGQPCKTCGNLLKGSRMGQRATVFCPHCQER
ncbi:MAG: bifunctional DNA-formamidopyrimidine glycosylase/DNA-(apurinic or apyrimidinic site) lyase [Pseudomonadales bacterium]